MGNYPNAAQGLKMIFWAAIAAIISAVVSVIPILGIIGAIAVIVCGIISFLGVRKASADDEGYHKALVYTIANIVIGIIQIFTDDIMIVGTLVGIAGSIVSLMVTYYICITTAKILRNVGSDAIADKGIKVWNIIKICTIISVICSFLSIIPIINIIAAVIAVVVAIVMIVAEIMYLIFLKNSYEALGA